VRVKCYKGECAGHCVAQNFISFIRSLIQLNFTRLIYIKKSLIFDDLCYATKCLCISDLMLSCIIVIFLSLIAGLLGQLLATELLLLLLLLLLLVNDEHYYTHAHTQPYHGSMDFVQDNPGEPVPEETFTFFTF